jgi:GNAT superfamily N-acetyltransferase
MPAPAYRIVEENLRAAMSCFAASKPGGEALDAPGLRLIYTGIDVAVFNLVLLNEDVQTFTDLRRRLDRARDYFTRKQSPWSFWLCEDLLEPYVRSLVPALVAEYGLEPSGHPPGMMTEKLAASSRKAPLLEYRPVEGAASRVDFCHVMSVAYEGPFATLMEAYDSDSFWRSGFEGWIGYADGRAVTTACTVTTPGAVGLYAVATLHGHRRKGCGEAVMRVAVAQASQKYGVDRVVLQSTPAGMSLYRRMGFETVTDFAIYVTSAK